LGVGDLKALELGTVDGERLGGESGCDRRSGKGVIGGVPGSAERLESTGAGPGAGDNG